MKQVLTCIEVRRLLLASPQQSNNLIDEHVANCPLCREYQTKLLVDEQRLQQALSVSVPSGLADRILFNARLQTKPRIPHWAIAASLFLFTGLALWWNNSRLPGTDWAAVAAEHVADEPEALNKVDKGAENKLSDLLSLWHVNLRHSLGRVLYADQCAFPQGRGMHTVFETDELGKITLILPPEQASGGSGFAQFGDYHAEAFQLSGKWMAVVSDDKRKLKSARAWVSERLAAL